MRYRPTTSLLLASPFGKRWLFESSSSRADSVPLAARMTAFARCRTTRRSASKYATPVHRPELSTVISCTYDRARISHRPVFSASGSIVTAELDRAFTWHPNPEHMPHCTQPDRPW